MEKQQYEELLNIYAQTKQLYQTRATLIMHKILLLMKVELVGLYNSLDPIAQAEEPPPGDDNPPPPPERQ